MFLWFFVLFVFNQSLACFFVRWFCVWYIFVCNTSVYNTSVCVWYICMWYICVSYIIYIDVISSVKACVWNPGECCRCFAKKPPIGKWGKRQRMHLSSVRCFQVLRLARRWILKKHVLTHLSSLQVNMWFRTEGQLSIKQIPLFRLSSCWILDQLVENFQAVFFRLFDGPSSLCPFTCIECDWSWRGSIYNFFKYYAFDGLFLVDQKKSYNVRFKNILFSFGWTSRPKN